MRRYTVIALYCFLCMLFYITSNKAEEYIPYYGKTDEAILQVVSAADARENGTFYACELLSFDNAKTKLSTNIRVFIKEDNGIFVYGDIVKADITILEPDVARNPGNFDYKQYLLTLNIGATATISSKEEATLLKNQWKNVIVGWSLQCKSAMTNALQACMPNGNSQMAEAIFLGNKDRLEQAVTEDFRASGIAHFMAVSGAHAAFFIQPFSFLLRKMKVKKQYRYIGEILLLLGYVAVSGFGIPVVRAGIMMGLKRLAFLVKRDYDPLVALLFSMAVLMAYNPFVIYSVSMQLSFGAVLSMYWLQPILKKALFSFRVTAYVSEKIIDSVCLCFSVQLGTLPILVNQLQMPSVLSVLTNLFCSPLVECIMIGGLIITFLGLLRLTFVGKILGYGLYFFCELLERAAASFATLSKIQTWRIVYFEWWEIVIYYFLLLAMVLVVRQGWRKVLAGVFCVFLISCSVNWPTTNLQLTCVDVGQGECIYLKTPRGKSYLIDCGSSSISDVGQYRMIPYLKTEKVSELEGIFLSHYDEDHISGLEAVLEAYKVRNLFLPEQKKDTEEAEALLKMASAYGTAVRYWKQGDSLTDGAVLIRCMHPLLSQTVRDDENAVSMVLKITYGDFDALLTGDLPQQQEREIMETVGDCEVLKVGHHGSATSSCSDFLTAVQPQIALISCGVNNRYGHPDKVVLERLEKIGCEIYVTAEGGALTATTDGKNIVVTIFL